MMPKVFEEIGRWISKLSNTSFTLRKNRRRLLGSASMFVERLEPRSVLTALAQPNLLSATVTSPTSVELRWQDVSGNDRYELFFKPAGSDASQWKKGASVDRDDTSGTIGGLTPGARYDFDIAAFKDSAHSPWSQVFTKTLPPVTPTLLTATANSASSVQLTWTNVSGEDEYRLYYKLAGASDDTYQRGASVGTNVTSGSINGLTPGTGYEFDIAAFKDGVRWKFSNRLTVTLPSNSDQSLNIVRYSQTDSRWASDKMGTSGKTIGQIGCMMTCLAAAYRVTPKVLNTWLSAHGGYDSQGRLIHNVAASYDGSDGLKYVGQGTLPTTGASTANDISHGTVYVTRSSRFSGQEHWVLVYSVKNGQAFYMDPMDHMDPMDPPGSPATHRVGAVEADGRVWVPIGAVTRTYRFS